MTRRLFVTIVSVVVATLIFVGLGTLGVATLRARATTSSELRTKVAGLVDGVTETLTEGIDENTGEVEAAQLIRRRTALVRRMAKVFELDDVAILITKDASVAGDLPTGIAEDDLDLASLAEGAVTSGSAGSTLWAAASTTTGARGRAVVIVVTRRADNGLGAATRWFSFAATLVLALGVAAALVLGRRLSRPIRGASVVAHRIAAGELSSRLPDPGSGGDELAELARSINTMAGNLERSRALEQEFLLSVSHDLRTPLTSIRGFAEALLDGAGDPGRAAGVIVSESKRLERLVADLLDLAKLQSSTFTVERRSLDLAALVRNSVAGFEAGEEAHGRVITFTSHGPALVLADGDRLGQVLANLLENASKYARHEVRVAVAGVGSHAVVTVGDDGPGIAPDDLPHVFERLYVARHLPDRRENSSGLGLAIVRELVQAMGGSVSASNATTGGALFRIEFPLIEVAPPVPGTPLPPPRLP